MFSRFLKLIVPPFTFRVFFRRIFYSNLKKVPLDKPLLFVGNHQNSFMDGMLVGSYFPQPIHFLMRADMFRRQVARFCLRELNVAPVYRKEEGMENVHKNMETFDGIYNVLRNNGNLIVFSEGLCVQEKRLQKLRKGTARMAFGAEEKYGLDVYIVPVGINYTYPSKFRKEVMINFHDAFNIKELKEQYIKNPAKGLLAFNKKVNDCLREEVIIIEDPANDWLAEQLFQITRNNYVLPFFKWKFDMDDRRLLEKELSEKINYLSANSTNKLEELTQRVTDYTALLKSRKLKDENIAREPDFGWLRYFAILAGFPVFLAGYVSNLLPFILPKFICATLIKDRRFYSSVYISSGTVIYLIYYPLIVLLAAVFTGWTGFFSALMLPFLGYISLFYAEIFFERMNTLRFRFESVRNPGIINDLKNQRKEIMSVIRNAPVS